MRAAAGLGRLRRSQDTQFSLSPAYRTTCWCHCGPRWAANVTMDSSSAMAIPVSSPSSSLASSRCLSASRYGLTSLRAATRYFQSTAA
eukprot:2428126-Amphidinium_carterae.3